MEAQYITITVAEYEDLLDRSEWLGFLEEAGVDNWEGINWAHELRLQEDDLSGRGL